MSKILTPVSQIKISLDNMTGKMDISCSPGPLPLALVVIMLSQAMLSLAQQSVQQPQSVPVVKP